jgi:cobalt-zinc-cadmium efflux system outer membrane protein
MLPRLPRAALVVLGALVARSALAAPLTPEEVVAAALARAPELVAAETAVDAARGERRQAATFLENPQVQVGRSVDGELTQAQATQSLSLFGEGHFARRAAGLRVDASEAAALRQRLVTAAEARALYVDTVVARQQAIVARDAYELSKGLRAAVERKLEVGEASELEARLARLAEAQSAASYLDARAEENDRLVALAALTGRGIPDLQLALDPLVAVPTAGEPSERADVRATELEAEAAKVALRRERAAVMPAVGVGAFYEDDGGVTAVGPMVGLEIPLWSRNQGGIASARADLAVAEARATWTAARAEAEQEAAATLLADASAFGPADPLADEAAIALRSIEAGYLAGELDLQEALFVRSQVLDGRSAAIELSGRVALARIEQLLAVGDAALLGGAR